MCPRQTLSCFARGGQLSKIRRTPLYRRRIRRHLVIVIKREFTTKEPGSREIKQLYITAHFGVARKEIRYPWFSTRPIGIPHYCRWCRGRCHLARYVNTTQARLASLSRTCVRRRSSRSCEAGESAIRACTARRSRGFPSISEGSHEQTTEKQIVTMHFPRSKLLLRDRSAVGGAEGRRQSSGT